MSNLMGKLLESVDQKDIIGFAEGINGLIAVTKNVVYLQRGKLLERKSLKTYMIKSITSIQTKKPSMLTAGHFQIIASGSGDDTKRFGSAFDYAKDENTVMIRGNFDDFKRIEQLIYKLQSDPSPAVPVAQAAPTSEDAFTKLEKLAKLKEQGIISEEEFELKKKDILSQV